MDEVREDESTTDRIILACDLLTRSFQLCDDEQFEQLKADISESARLMKEVISATTNRYFSEREADLIREYLELSHNLAEVIRVRRSSVKQAYMQLNNSEKIRNSYTSTG